MADGRIPNSMAARTSVPLNVLVRSGSPGERFGGFVFSWPGANSDLLRLR